MNKQTIGKAQLFLEGIIGRIDENADFFEGIDVTFTAGTKKFFLKAMLCGERCGGEKRTLEFIFCGEKYVKSLGEFGCFIGEKMRITIRWCLRMRNEAEALCLRQAERSQNTYRGKSLCGKKRGRLQKACRHVRHEQTRVLHQSRRRRKSFKGHRHNGEERENPQRHDT